MEKIKQKILPKVKEKAVAAPRELVRNVAERTREEIRTSQDYDSINADTADRAEYGIESLGRKGAAVFHTAGKAAGHKILSQNEKKREVQKERVRIRKEAAREEREAVRTQGKKETQTVRQQARAQATERIKKCEFTVSVRSRYPSGIRTQEAEKRRIASKIKRRQKHTYEAGKRLAVKSRQASKKTGGAVKQVTKAVKEGVKAAIKVVLSSIPGMIVIGIIVVILIIVLGIAVSVATGGGQSESEVPLSEEVLAYTSMIQKYASQYGIGDYVASIQAIMMQESGGSGTDPMQASECPYNTQYPNTPGGITDPEYSIQVGIQYYADCVVQAGCESPTDMNRLYLSWQGYNFGNGYIGWALDKDGGYTAENALQFSQEQAAAHGWSGYGDPEYVPHVKRYYSYGGILGGLFGNGQIVSVALSQLGNDGETYWKWYGFSTYQEWCAYFVSWCADQCMLIESGAMPKFSYCPTGMSWFQSKGRWEDRNFQPPAGVFLSICYSVLSDLQNGGKLRQSCFLT